MVIAFIGSYMRRLLESSGRACEKARVRSCCEKVKIGTVVTGTAGVKEFVPEGGKRRRLVRIQHDSQTVICRMPRNMSRLQRPAEETFTENLW